MNSPSVPPDNSIPNCPFNYEDIASQPLVEPMLTEMMGAPKPDGDNTVRNAARDYALKEIGESARIFCTPLTMGALEGQTWFFIQGFREGFKAGSERRKEYFK